MKIWWKTRTALTGYGSWRTKQIFRKSYQELTDNGTIPNFRTCAPLQQKNNFVEGTIIGIFDLHLTVITLTEPWNSMKMSGNKIKIGIIGCLALLTAQMKKNLSYSNTAKTAAKCKSIKKTKWEGCTHTF